MALVAGYRVEEEEKRAQAKEEQGQALDVVVAVNISFSFFFSDALNTIRTRSRHKYSGPHSRTAQFQFYSERAIDDDGLYLVHLAPVACRHCRRRSRR